MSDAAIRRGDEIVPGSRPGRCFFAAEWTDAAGVPDDHLVNLGERLSGLDVLQQNVVTMVYFEGRTLADAARLLSVERVAVGAALAHAFRDVASWVIDGSGPPE